MSSVWSDFACFGLISDDLVSLSNIYRTWKVTSSLKATSQLLCAKEKNPSPSSFLTRPCSASRSRQITCVTEHVNDCCYSCVLPGLQALIVRNSWSCCLRVWSTALCKGLGNSVWAANEIRTISKAMTQNETSLNKRSYRTVLQG